MKYLKFIIWLFVAYFIGNIVGQLNPKIITKLQTQYIQLAAPTMYLCNSEDKKDISNCYVIQAGVHNTYCFDNYCSYIYTDKELK